MSKTTSASREHKQAATLDAEADDEAAAATSGADVGRKPFGGVGGRTRLTRLSGRTDLPLVSSPSATPTTSPGESVSDTDSLQL